MHHKCCDVITLMTFTTISDSFAAQFKPSLHSRYYTETYNEWQDPSPRLSVWTTQKRQRWRAVGDTVCDLTGPGVEPPTSRSDSDVSNHYFHRRGIYTQMLEIGTIRSAPTYVTTYTNRNQSCEFELAHFCRSRT